MFILCFLLNQYMFSVKINVTVLLHIDVNGGLLPTGSSSPDYIDQSLLLRNLTKRGLKVMLTITELIAVISLCVAFYSLGYVRGKHDAKIEK